MMLMRLKNGKMTATWKRTGSSRRMMEAIISTLHKDHLPCKLATHKLDDSRGAYNINCKVEFSNGEKWVVRFPMVGKVMNADEKVEIEVAPVKLIHQQTNMPIPDIKAWGSATDNPLGIDVGVDEILQHPNARMMKEDVSEHLQELECPRIGSLTLISTTGELGFSATTNSRPLTQKAHDFIKKVELTFLTYLSITEYFHHVVDQDREHFHIQPNSVDNAEDPRDRFVYWNVMTALIASHVLPSQDKGLFKLMFDDFQPPEMIVNNEQDPKVIAAVHPTPLCLLIESPNTWASVDERLTRFNKHLELSTRILEGEEKKVLDDDVDEHEKPSALLKECQKQGRQWFHFILLCGINGPTCVPFVKLREETADWDELVSAVLEDKIKAFVQKKVADLQTSEILRLQVMYI
ncbi:hypothetical protein F4824DRAFT_485618 [Ustulina deusta]|nr:hypothetical protein F4824DRAFT_485618 [Ustulina deusta]